VAVSWWPFGRRTQDEGTPDAQAPEPAESPEAALDLVEWGIRLGMLGKPELAAQRLARAVKNDPRDPAAHYNLGLALDQMGEHSKAAESYARAVELAPESVDVRVNLGAALLGSGNVRGAIKELKKAVEFAPDDSSAPFALACAYLANRSYKKAVEAFRRAVEADPGDPETRFNLAVALRKAGCPDLAEIELRGFLELAGDRFPEHRAYAERTLNETSPKEETGGADDTT